MDPIIDNAETTGRPFAANTVRAERSASTLTVREYFAAQALQGILATSPALKHPKNPFFTITPEKIAERAVDLADKTMAQLGLQDDGFAWDWEEDD